MAYDFIIYVWVLIGRVWHKWVAVQFMINLGRATLGFIASVLMGMYPFALSISVLVMLDMFFGVKASLRRGEPFKSKKLWRGLLQRAFLYTALIVTFIMLDTLLQGVYDYGKFYVSIIVCTLIGFYEAGSILEKLVYLYPGYPFLKKIGNTLNLLEKQNDENTVNLVSKIIENEKT